VKDAKSAAVGDGPEQSSERGEANRAGPRATDERVRLDACDSSAPIDAVEHALALGLEAAVKAGRLDLVQQLASELQARRLARSAGNVVPIETATKRNGGKP
jgi:hypothetical protein